MDACFHLFGPEFTWLWAPTGHFLAPVFLETKPKSALLEPLNGFLAYLELKSWLKNQIFNKNEEVTKKV